MIATRNLCVVVPANAGSQCLCREETLDSRLRGNDAEAVGDLARPTRTVGARTTGLVRVTTNVVAPANAGTQRLCFAGRYGESAGAPG